MSIAEFPKTTDRVRAQYEKFPYPLRDPEDERRRIYATPLDDLGALNFYCYRGRRDFRQGFRALVAGGGTGDAVMHLAEQLRNTDAEIVYLDISEAAMLVAQQRARVRGIEEKVDWVQGSLLDLQQMDLGPFDYINCSGVLHHLEDPAAGLAALKSVLKEEGAIGLMLYGRYGRTGIDQLQKLMRLINHDLSDLEGQELENAHAVIDRLPATNWCKRALDLFPIYDQLDDTEIYDLLLHKRDRTYTVTDVYELLDRCGLQLVEHTKDQRPLYEPGFAFPEPPLRTQIEKLSRREQQAATELFWGAITQHSFWASPNSDTIAELTDPDNVPFFSRAAIMQKVQESILSTAGDEWSWKCPLNGEVEVMIAFHVVPAARRFIELIDDNRTLGEIVETILSAYNPAPPAEEAWKVCRYAMEVLIRQDLLLLRHKTVPPVFL